MRLDRQSGFWAFYWHYVIRPGFSINIALFSKDINLQAIAILAGYLGLWTTVFRGITCTWNDNLDQDFDRRVARCRVRPIPRGAITTVQAYFFTAAQMATGACILYPCGNRVLGHAGIGNPCVWDKAKEAMAWLFIIHSVQRMVKIITGNDVYNFGACKYKELVWW